jgi:hypothetical protein
MRPSRSDDNEMGKSYGAAEVRRLRDAAMVGLRDEEWGTELGQLFLEGKITGAMYGAGKWWRSRAARYYLAINAPPPAPRAISLELRSGSTGPDPDSEEGQNQTKWDRAAVEDFQEAHAILLGAGALSEKYIRDLCEQNIRPFGTEALMAVSRGLEWLAEYRQLTNQQKGAYGR